MLFAGRMPFAFPTQNINSNSGDPVEVLKHRDSCKKRLPKRVLKFPL